MGTRAPARFAVIMAGGAGTRFWPLSRAARPKQFLHLAGRGTMLQETARRLRGVVPRQRVLVVAPPAHVRLVRAQLPWLTPANLIVEPAPRGTAACLALVAAQVARRAPEAALAVLAADHAITDVAALRVCLRRAFDGRRRRLAGHLRHSADAAGDGLRIRARSGAPLDRARPRAARALRFVEKPDCTHRPSLGRRRRLSLELGNVRLARRRVPRRPLHRHAPRRRGGAGGAGGARRRGGAARLRAPAEPADRRRGARARRAASPSSRRRSTGATSAAGRRWPSSGAPTPRATRGAADALLLDCRRHDRPRRHAVWSPCWGPRIWSSSTRRTRCWSVRATRAQEVRRGGGGAGAAGRRGG